MSKPQKSYTRRNREQWLGLVQNHQQSHLSAKAFCELHDIGYASFCNWRSRLTREEHPQEDAESTPDTGFIDLSALPNAQPSGWQIVLKLGDGVELVLNRP